MVVMANVPHVRVRGGGGTSNQTLGPGEGNRSKERCTERLAGWFSGPGGRGGFGVLRT